MATIKPSQDPQSPQEHVDRARSLLSGGQLEQAIAELGIAISIDPASMTFRAMRGSLYARNKQWQEARMDFREALRLQPDDPDLLTTLGRLEYQTGNAREAIPLLRRSLELQDNSSLHLLLIDVSLAAKEYDNALLEMDRYSQRKIGDTNMYTKRIRALSGAGREAEVQAIIDGIIAAQNGSASGYLMASTYCYLAEQNDRALALATEGIRLAPNNGFLYFQRAQVQNDPAAQRSDLQQTVKLQPENDGAFIQLAQVNLKLKDYRATVQVLDQLQGLSRFSPKFDFFSLRGDAMAGLGDNAGAVLAYASARSKADGMQLNNMCWSKVTANRMLDEALKDCDAALTLLPQCWGCHDSRGTVLLQLKRFPEAIASYDTAVRGDPKSAASLYCRGIAKLRLKRKAEGNADIAAAIALAPDIAEQYDKYGIRP